MAGQSFFQHFPDALEQQVAHRVPVLVVDELEMVDVDHHERKRLVRVEAAEMSDAFEKSEAVVESGQMVFAGAAVALFDQKVLLDAFEMRADRSGNLAELEFHEFEGNVETLLGDFEIPHRRAGLEHVARNADRHVRLARFEPEKSGTVDGDVLGEIRILAYRMLGKIRGDATAENVVDIVDAERADVACPGLGKVSAHPYEMELGSESERLGDFAHGEVEEFADALRTVHEIENRFHPPFEIERRP